ncbi:hypothetical protein GC163_08335 [bacterium]|nr:hypothetical protein [bacterium]
MHIEYHDLSAKDFERLVVAICIEILGPGVASFCAGKDGSRDARFEGTANHFPSSANPYKGKFIIQAKHTEDPVAKYSDPDFSSERDSSVISGECLGVKKLVDDGHLDIYFLFSNRKMSGVAEEPIRSRITRDTGAKTIELFGIERIDNLLKKFKQALQTFGAEPMNLPLLVTCEDLSEVILAISQNKAAFTDAFMPDDLQRVSFKRKNENNGLSSDLAEYIRRQYVPQFDNVKKFLARPGNEAVRERYEAAALEFEEQIAIHRKAYGSFDDVLIRVKSLLAKRDGDLARNKALTNLVVYYMYWNCDIGSKVESDVEAE